MCLNKIVIGFLSDFYRNFHEIVEIKGKPRIKDIVTNPISHNYEIIALVWQQFAINSKSVPKTWLTRAKRPVCPTKQSIRRFHQKIYGKSLSSIEIAFIAFFYSFKEVFLVFLISTLFNLINKMNEILTKNLNYINKEMLFDRIS